MQVIAFHEILIQKTIASITFHELTDCKQNIDDMIELIFSATS